MVESLVLNLGSINSRLTSYRGRQPNRMAPSKTCPAATRQCKRDQAGLVSHSSSLSIGHVIIFSHIRAAGVADTVPAMLNGSSPFQLQIV